MTRLERYREQLAKLEKKRSTHLRSGRFIEANNLINDLGGIRENDQTEVAERHRDQETA